MSRTIHPRTFACGVFLESKHHRVRLKGVLVEQDSEVRVASVGNELIGDVRNMITGFLKNNRMELSTGSRENIYWSGSCGPVLDTDTDTDTDKETQTQTQTRKHRQGNTDTDTDTRRDTQKKQKLQCLWTGHETELRATRHEVQCA